MVPARPSFRPFRLRPRRRRHVRRASGLRQLQPRASPLASSTRVGGGRRPASAALALAITTAALSPPPRPRGARARQADPPAPAYSPPVSAPIADPFRPPAGPYGAGNRGIEYDTEPGDPVRASADGIVVFAGPVAGTLHVTLRHADGVRTSYSFLGAVDVVLGQRVAAGDASGSPASGCTSGLGRATPTSTLPPCSSATRSRSSCCRSRSLRAARREAEARALAQLAFDGGGGVGFPGVDAALGWLYDRARSTATYATQLNLPARGLGLAADLGARLFLHGPCSDGPPPAAPVRDQDRVAITVAGLGSSSSNGSIDELRTADLGYDDDRVVRFSYAGGRVPGSAAALGDLASRAYETGASQGDLHGARPAGWPTWCRTSRPPIPMPRSTSSPTRRAASSHGWRCSSWSNAVRRSTGSGSSPPSAHRTRAPTWPRPSSGRAPR